MKQRLDLLGLAVLPELPRREGRWLDLQPCPPRPCQSLTSQSLTWGAHVSPTPDGAAALLPLNPGVLWRSCAPELTPEVLAAAGKHCHLLVAAVDS